MADDLSKRVPADQLRINVNDPYERGFWMREFGVTAERLRQLVHNHGDLAADIRAALGKS